jgi:hypothetical protein
LILERKVEVSGFSDATQPSLIQINLFHETRNNISSLVRKAIDEIWVGLPQLKNLTIVLNGICLNKDESSFSFYFDVIERPKEVPWGLYADFVGFEIEEAGGVH